MVQGIEASIRDRKSIDKVRSGRGPQPGGIFALARKKKSPHSTLALKLAAGSIGSSGSPKIS